jgi:hypothetical protein
MEAYRIDRFGSVDGIVLRSSEDPRPGPKEILMRVRASSLNYRDLMVLKGGGRGPTKLGVAPLSFLRHPRMQIFSSSKSSPANCRLAGGARSKARCGSLAPIAPSCSSRASLSPKASCSDSLTLSAAAGGKIKTACAPFQRGA